MRGKLKKRNIKKNYELVKQLAITDFKLKYQRSFLGYLWSLFKPLSFFLVLYTVFTRVFKLGNSVPHYINYLFLGTVLWSFFAEATTAGMFSVASRGDFIKKVYFPRALLVLATLLNSTITFTLNSIILAAFMFFLGNNLGTGSFLLPLIIFELLVLVTGISFLLSSLYVKYRDLGHIWEILMQVAFYATPIIYPVSFVPSDLQPIVMVNPIAQIVQDARYLLITNQTIRAVDVLGKYSFIPYVIPFMIFVFGYTFFKVRESNFAEDI